MHHACENQFCSLFLCVCVCVLFGITWLDFLAGPEHFNEIIALLLIYSTLNNLEPECMISGYIRGKEPSNLQEPFLFVAPIVGNLLFLEINEGPTMASFSHLLTIR